VSEIRSYAYVAATYAGEDIRGSMNATSERAVMNELIAAGYIPVSVKLESSGLNFDITASLSSRPLKLKVAEAAELSRQLFQLLNAGVSVPQAFSTIGRDSNDKFRLMCEDVSTKVSQGVPISDALADHPRAFDPVFVAYVRAGEESGTLEAALGRLSEMLTKRASTRNKIKQVTAYPKIVSAVIAVIVFGVLKFLVPMFADIYASFDAPLPAPTQFVIDVSNRIVYVIAGIAALVFGGWSWVRRYGDEPKWAKAIDTLRFRRMPLFAKLTHLSTLQRWASTLQGTLDAGVGVQNALPLAAQASDSRWIKSITPDLIAAVSEGRPLSEELIKSPELFPSRVRTMVVVGEETGDIPEMLDSVTAAIESDIDRVVATLGARIEVALLAGLGGVVGSLLIVLYLPILSLTTTVMESAG
jgi:type IV pilus assembly protein PilC